MMLVIRTQLHENYGAHDWDGKGECAQRWKAKGGSEYKILGVPEDITWHNNPSLLGRIVEAADIEEDNNYFRVKIVDWSFEQDDYLSWFEQSQLQYEGVIGYKEPTLDYNILIKELV